MSDICGLSYRCTKTYFVVNPGHVGFDCRPGQTNPPLRAIEDTDITPVYGMISTTALALRRFFAQRCNSRWDKVELPGMHLPPNREGLRRSRR